jgi:NAD(P)-dependent dehydrogenase (short-subunit alcohol dehydrogenase family)
MANGTIMDNDKFQSWIDTGVPIKRKGVPHEVADLCLFLCSERATYIVGETISVDGGLGAL